MAQGRRVSLGLQGALERLALLARRGNPGRPVVSGRQGHRVSRARHLEAASQTHPSSERLLPACQCSLGPPALRGHLAHLEQPVRVDSQGSPVLPGHPVSLAPLVPLDNLGRLVLPEAPGSQGNPIPSALPVEQARSRRQALGFHLAHSALRLEPASHSRPALSAQRGSP